MAVVSEEVQTEKNWKSVLVSNWRSYVRHQSKQSFLRIRLKKKKKKNRKFLHPNGSLVCLSEGPCKKILSKHFYKTKIMNYPKNT